LRIARKPAIEVQLRAGQVVPYRRVAELIGLVHAAELTRIGFVTESAAPGP
jgi:biopolymer transport protein TolR